jgi:hypothetical protein
MYTFNLIKSKINQNSSAICRFYLTFDNSGVRSIKIRKVVIVFNILN